jgi:hypothetical protein
VSGTDRTEVARSKGFEPLTPRFEVWCSIQLSYERMRSFGRVWWGDSMYHRHDANSITLSHAIFIMPRLSPAHQIGTPTV